MKRGVGIRMKTEHLDRETLRQWLFDNVGPPNEPPGALVASDEARGVFFTWYDADKTLRVGVWTEEAPPEAWKEIERWAARISRECRCNLESWRFSLHEYDPTIQGYKCIYDQEVPDKQELTTVVTGRPGDADRKPKIKWN